MIRVILLNSTLLATLTYKVVRECSLHRATEDYVVLIVSDIFLRAHEDKGIHLYLSIKVYYDPGLKSIQWSWTQHMYSNN